MAILQNDGREQTSLILVKCGGSPRNLPPNPNTAKTIATTKHETPKPATIPLQEEKLRPSSATKGAKTNPKFGPAS